MVTPLDALVALTVRVLLVPQLEVQEAAAGGVGVTVGVTVELDVAVDVAVAVDVRTGL